MSICYTFYMPDEKLHRVLQELKRELKRILGEQLDRVLLYGSHARGEAHAGSDVDVLVVLKRPYQYGELIRLTSEIIAELSLDYEIEISRVFVSKERFEREKTPFLINVRREAIAI